MTIESVTYISDLNVLYPAGTDAKSEGDDHIRNLKTAIKNTFPNINAAVTGTDEQLNAVADVLTGNKTFSGNNTFSGTVTMSGKSIYEANASVAANATTSDIWSGGNYATLTGGAVTFTDFADAPQAGVEVELYCNAAHVFTNNANIEIDGGANWTAAAGDRALVRAKSTTVFTLHPRNKNGAPVTSPASLGSSMVYLATITGSGAASLDSTAIMSSTYGEYWFVCQNLIPSNDGADLLVRVGTGAGPTFASGAGTYKWALSGSASSAGGALSGGSNADSQIYLDFTGNSVDANVQTAGWSGVLKVIQPTVAVRKHIHISGIYQTNDGSESIVTVIGGGTYAGATTALTGIQIRPTAGTITGNIYVYGIKTS